VSKPFLLDMVLKAFNVPKVFVLDMALDKTFTKTCTMDMLGMPEPICPLKFNMEVV
jgi:hypothetical protein